MVGYVEDAIIESKIRLRFDAGFGNRVPDRAEFFYAKCGCYQDLAPADPQFDPDAPGPSPGAANDIRFQQLYLPSSLGPAEGFRIRGESRISAPA
jgi:hypothetical protein